MNERLIPPRTPVPAGIDCAHNRLMVGAILIFVMFAAIGIRLIELAAFKGSETGRSGFAAAGGTFSAGRGDIVDRNGTVLATSLTTASLYANPQKISNPKRTAARLAAILPEVSEAQLRDRLDSDRSFVWLHRNLTPRQQYEVNRLGVPGLDFRSEQRRIYPMGKIAGHVLGYTDIDGNGIAGIERSFDDTLKTGSRDVALSIDIRLQHLLRRELKGAMREFRSVGAAGVILDAKSGEVLAMVSLPGFDPNQPAAARPEDRFNRTTLGVYEMGSTFKIFTTAMALETGRISLASGYDTTDPIRISRFVIRDYHAKRRWLSIPEIFMYSSNIGAAKMAIDVGIPQQRDFLKRIGMLRPSPIELPEVGMPLMPTHWREINAMTIAFGHGISVSPMQLASGVAAMINGGVWHPPTLIRREPGAKPSGKRVISARTSLRMRQLMRLVVEDGTGRNADAIGYLVGGKTGTAEKPSGKHYRAHALLSSFVGAFPINDPRYVVLAILDEPHGNKRTHGFATGGWVAAPVVKRVVEAMAPMVGMSPIDPELPEIRRAVSLPDRYIHSERTRLASY